MLRMIENEVADCRNRFSSVFYSPAYVSSFFGDIFMSIPSFVVLLFILILLCRRV